MVGMSFAPFYYRGYIPLMNMYLECLFMDIGFLD